MNDFANLVAKQPTLISIAPIVRMRSFVIPWIAFAGAIQVAQKVYTAADDSIVSFEAVLDVDPNGVNPQNTQLIISMTSEPTLQNGKVLYRHIPHERTVVVPKGQSWYCVSVIAAGTLTISERTIKL